MYYIITIVNAFSCIVSGPFYLNFTVSEFITFLFGSCLVDSASVKRVHFRENGLHNRSRNKVEMFNLLEFSYREKWYLVEIFIKERCVGD